MWKIIQFTGSCYPQIKQMGSQILIKTLLFLISSMLPHLKLSRVIFAALKLLETFQLHLAWKVSSSGAFGFDISWLGSGCPLKPLTMAQAGQAVVFYFDVSPTGQDRKFLFPS